MYSRNRPELRAGLTSPTLSQRRRVEGLMPRIRAVCPTVRKRSSCLWSCRAVEFFSMEFPSGFWRHRRDPLTRPVLIRLMVPIFWISQQASALLRTGTKNGSSCSLWTPG